MKYFCTALLMTACTSGCAPLGRMSPLRGMEQAIVFQPAPWPEALPASASEFEQVEFTSSDGLQLAGWYLEHPDPVAVALFCHGNGGNLMSCAETLKVLRDQHQLSALAFDYRGYGRSQGQPTEAGVIEDWRGQHDAGWLNGPISTNRKLSCLVNRWAVLWRSTWLQRMVPGHW